MKKYVKFDEQHNALLRTFSPVFSLSHCTTFQTTTASHRDTNVINFNWFPCSFQINKLNNACRASLDWECIECEFYVA